jgi:antitoxin (DNA-binding transcriptional repressor) of toxin-antitoxin stability system
MKSEGGEESQMSRNSVHYSGTNTLNDASEATMRFFSVRDMRANTKEIQETMRNDDDAIITKNGKPFAMMIPLNEDDYADTIRILDQIRFKKSLDRIHAASLEAGLDKMSLEDINEEIRQARIEAQQE